MAANAPIYRPTKADKVFIIVSTDKYELEREIAIGIYDSKFYTFKDADKLAVDWLDLLTPGSTVYCNRDQSGWFFPVCERV